jgi:hypothetical protein
MGLPHQKSTESNVRFGLPDRIESGSRNKWAREAPKQSIPTRRLRKAMNTPVDPIVRPTRAFRAAGCLLMVVAGLVHFRCCDWDLSFLGKSSEPEVLDVRYIVGPIYPDESFPGNVWDAGILGVMLPGSLVLVGLFFLALADNRQAVPLRSGEGRRRASVSFVSFGQAERLHYQSVLQVPPPTTARPLPAKPSGVRPVARTGVTDHRIRQYAVCPFCGCFSIVERLSPGRSIECPFCARLFTLEDRTVSRHLKTPSASASRGQLLTLDN